MNWMWLSQKPETFWTCLYMGTFSQSSLKIIPQGHFSLHTLSKLFQTM